MCAKKALVVGATGIIGSHILEHLIASEDWEVIGTARKVPKDNSSHYISIDLLDKDDVKEKINSIAGITHIFYAAYQDHPPLSKALLEFNTNMLANIVSAVSEDSHHDLNREMNGVKFFRRIVGCNIKSFTHI